MPAQQALHVLPGRPVSLEMPSTVLKSQLGFASAASTFAQSSRCSVMWIAELTL